MESIRLLYDIRAADSNQNSTQFLLFPKAELNQANAHLAGWPILPPFVLASAVLQTKCTKQQSRCMAWSMEHGAWSMEHGAWSMEHGVQHLFLPAPRSRLHAAPPAAVPSSATKTKPF